VTLGQTKGTGTSLRSEVPVPDFEANPVTLGQTKGTGTSLRSEVPVPDFEAIPVTLGQTKGTGTSLRSGASPFCLPQSENEPPLTGASIRLRAFSVDGYNPPRSPVRTEK
jgi:hypothetical protein